MSAGAADIQFKVENASGMPVADAIVYAVALMPTVHSAPLQAEIDQVNREFVPRVSVIQTGASVEFPNRDKIRHAVYSFSPPKIFNLKLYADKPASPVIFDKPGVVVLGCTIHDHMVAWVLVVDTPHFTRTDGNGAATLGQLPPGDYQVYAWREPMAAPAAGEPLHVEASPQTLHVLRLDAP